MWEKRNSINNHELYLSPANESKILCIVADHCHWYYKFSYHAKCGEFKNFTNQASETLRICATCCLNESNLAEYSLQRSRTEFNASKRRRVDRTENTDESEEDDDDDGKELDDPNFDKMKNLTLQDLMGEIRKEPTQTRKTRREVKKLVNSMVSQCNLVEDRLDLVVATQQQHTEEIRRLENKISYLEVKT